MPDCNCLNSSSSALVADTSVVVNLSECGFVETVLEALPNQLLIPETVREELERGVERGRRQRNPVSDLRDSGLAEVVMLGAAGTKVFENLVSGAAGSTLGDGESATIASAIEFDAIALIGDRKALRICSANYPSLVTASTVDLFSQHQVQAGLGKKQLSNAVYNALSSGRMRVPKASLEWVVELIGAARALRCKSLPRSFRKTLLRLEGQ